MLKKIFYVNDGLDGVILARGLKQVIHILSKEYGICKSEIRRYLKHGRDSWLEDNWDIYKTKYCRKGKSRVLGYYE